MVLYSPLMVKKEALINETKRLKKFALLVCWHPNMSLTRAQLKKAFPPLQREVSEQLTHRLYSTQALRHSRLSI